jgi:hypothetical protein
MRVLFIGNSFTQRNDLPGLVAQLATAGDPPQEVATERVIASGANLRQHWNAGTAACLIQEHQWDVVVLQEQRTLPIKNAARYHENVQLFHTLIEQRGARTALYLTWARRHAPETQQALNSAAEEIARETGALIVPVRRAWERVLAAGSRLKLYDADGSHPSPPGSYLAACVF